MEQPETIGKIAVVRANGIGDYFFAQPALAALRAAYPRAEIVLLGKRWHAAFLNSRPGPIDRALEIPPYGGVSAEPGAVEDAHELERFFQRMQAERFDVAVQMHGGGRYSNPFTRRLGAGMTVGMRAADASALDRYIPYIYFQPEIPRYLEVVALLGARPLGLTPTLSLTPADHAELDALGLTGEPLAVIHPGATDPRRRWPTSHFVAVGNLLAGRGARIAVTGTGDERELVTAIATQIPAALPLYERLSLGGVAALMARSRIVIANDSGPLHLAVAVGARTVGIFWCGNLINGGPLTRTRHRPCISWRLHCPLCERNTLYDACDHRVSFVADVTVEEVATAALALYADAELLALDDADASVALDLG